MALPKRITATNAFQETVGTLGAWYLRLTWHTSRHVYDPPNIYDIIELPAIFTMWHGQHFLAPFIPKNDVRHRAKFLISRHRDGEINARAAAHLGIEAIRGSGAHNGDFRRKGGATAFNEMVQALEEGYNMALTADVPKVARVCGMGVVKLAQYSGRPIYPIAIASSRRIELDNWDKSAVNLPFSRIGLVAGKPITVPRKAEEEELEALRQQVENELNRVTQRAYALADGKEDV